MIRIGVISNPYSRRNLRGGMSGIRAVLSEHPEVLHAELDTVTDLAGVLAEFARREVGLIVINGGDGTVQATLTELINGARFETLPLLSVLPAGTTNLIALDVGPEGRPDTALARLIASGGEGARLIRPVLSMTYAGDRPPVYGMFFGAGAFYRGTMLGRARVHPLGVAQSTAAGMTIGLSLLWLLAGRRGRRGIVRGDVSALRTDGRADPHGKYFVALATTLDRLLLGVRPFWGGGTGPLRYTAIAYPPRRLGRALLPVLFGRPRPWMAESGYVSGLADRLSLAASCPVVLDGEIFTPRPGVPVVLKGEHHAAFLRC